VALDEGDAELLWTARWQLISDRSPKPIHRRTEKENRLCIRVLAMSRGWTVNVAMVPANKPAITSTVADERPA